MLVLCEHCSTLINLGPVTGSGMEIAMQWKENWKYLISQNMNQKQGVYITVAKFEHVDSITISCFGSTYFPLWSQLCWPKFYVAFLSPVWQTVSEFASTIFSLLNLDNVKSQGFQAFKHWIYFNKHTHCIKYKSSASY